MSVPERFKAFRIHQGPHRAALEDISLSDLNPGEVTIRTAYSSVNYKDALAGTGRGKILRQFPLVGGIDVAGHVVESRDPRFREGDAVLVTGSGLSEHRDGGYSEYLRLEGEWVVPLPPNLSLREAMGIGTAGFTAALCLWRMLSVGQRPEMGPIVVTGATGGVGMLATVLFANAGYAVHAVSGKPEHAALLRSLGASEVLARDAFLTGRPMDSVRFGGALDNVGGATLADLLAQTAPYGNVASCGLVASAELPASVMPFIIRGVSLLGIASAGTARPIRERVWALLAHHFDTETLAGLPVRETGMDGLPAVFERMLAGASFGRTVVRIAH